MKWGIGLVLAALLLFVIKPGTVEAGSPLLNPAAVDVSGKQTIWVPAGAMTVTVTAGAAGLATAESTAGRPDMSVQDFDKDSDEHVQFSIGMPKNWNEGTVTFQLMWTQAAGSTTGVAFGLQCLALGDSDTFDAVFGTAVLVTDDGLNTAKDLMISAESSAITVGGSPAEGDIVVCDLYRDVSDGNDDLNADARVVGIRLHYTTDANNDD